MPIFMDRHNARGVSADEMAAAHQLDLGVQAEYQVHFLAYWFDQVSGLAFCLVDAPHAQAVKEVHRSSHGNVPAEIIGVELEEVRSFLGRVTDTVPAEVDSAFRSIMITDLEGSTALTARVGDAKAIQLLSLHDQVVESACRVHGGQVVKHTGDGLLVSFPQVDDALWSAIEIQSELHSLARESEAERLSVRVGINPGNPIERGNDIFGLAVQVAARICQQASPGQILASGIIRELTEDETLRRRLRSAGRIQIRGLESALQVYEVDWNTP